MMRRALAWLLARLVNLALDSAENQGAAFWRVERLP
jgi:hypothetical protein